MVINSKTLVFSIALNGYQHLYKRNLVTQQRYAQRHGYEYVAVTQPALSLLGLECAWLKISLLTKALYSGYATVLYLDADTCVSEATPPVESLIKNEKYLYLARGFSGRFNSGVMLVRNHAQIIAGFEHMLATSEQSVAAEDSVGWGENGHVIAFAKNNSLVQEISREWNNNTDPALDDYIRHYSMGPMRPLFKTSLVNRLAFFTCRCIIAAGKRLLKPQKFSFLQRLNLLTQRSCAAHQQFQY